MKGVLSLLLLLWMVSSCVAKKAHYYKANMVTRRDSVNSQDSVRVLFKKCTAQQYIEQYKGVAVDEMKKFGIPASITLAQGLLESSNGNSTLARTANNHFGIKCPGGWNGDAVYQDDDAPSECFRAYRTAEESFRDHSDFLKTKKRYAFLFNYAVADYVSWAHGLKQAGYATNPQYPQLLIMLIERYQLYQYDPEGKCLSQQEEDPFFTEAELEAIINTILPMPNQQAATFYRAKVGDTFFSIARRFGLTIEELKTINKLNSTDLKVDRALRVSKN